MIGSFGEMVATQPNAFNQRNFAVIGQQRTIDIITHPIIFQTGIVDDHMTIEQLSNLDNNYSPLPNNENFLANVELPKELFLELMKKERTITLVSVGYRDDKLFSRLNQTGEVIFLNSYFQM